tara:strand:+ start:600 stop:959 length:360 start_codon:yes stop_codon:yes gene_type:complete
MIKNKSNNVFDIDQMEELIADNNMEIPSVYIPCSVCGYNIDWLEFEQHITVFEPCQYCERDKVFSRHAKDKKPWHDESNCTNRKKKELYNWWQQQEHWWHHNKHKSYSPKHKHCETNES